MNLPGVRPSTPDELARTERWTDALRRVHDAQDRYAMADAARDKDGMAKALRDFEIADADFNEACDAG